MNHRYLNFIAIAISFKVFRSEVFQINFHISHCIFSISFCQESWDAADYFLHQNKKNKSKTMSCQCWSGRSIKYPSKLFRILNSTSNLAQRVWKFNKFWQALWCNTTWRTSILVKENTSLQVSSLHPCKSDYTFINFKGFPVTCSLCFLSGWWSTFSWKSFLPRHAFNFLNSQFKQK